MDLAAHTVGDRDGGGGQLDGFAERRNCLGWRATIVTQVLAVLEERLLVEDDIEGQLLWPVVEECWRLRGTAARYLRGQAC